jgi:hypothetical protein
MISAGAAGRCARLRSSRAASAAQMCKSGHQDHSGGVLSITAMQSRSQAIFWRVERSVGVIGILHRRHAIRAKADVLRFAPTRYRECDERFYRASAARQSEVA